MAYAFENTPWHELPLSEQIAIATMQAQIRDNQLTPAELYVIEYERIQYLRSIGHPKYADPILEVGESKEVTLMGKRYTMTRTQ